MKTKLTLIPVLAVTALAFMTGNVEAREENELVRLAHSIEDIVEDLEEEFEQHYEHSGAFRHLMSDLSKIENEAEHIDALAHNPHSSIRHIKTDLEDLDRLAHHLHNVIDAVSRGRYSGHVDGSTRHVHSKLSSLNSTIHRMKRVAASYGRPIHHDDHYGRHGGHSGHSDDRGARVIGAVIGAIFERHGGHHPHH